MAWRYVVFVYVAGALFVAALHLLRAVKRDDRFLTWAFERAARNARGASPVS